MANEKIAGQKKVKIFYEHDPAYRIVAANGMFGGITPRGELRCDFFVEYVEPPKSITLLLSNKDKPKEESEEPNRIVRRVQFGVLVSPSHVRSFAKWFQAKADQIDEMKEISDEHSQAE